MKDSKPHVMCIVGARPNFMKIAPIMKAFKQQDRVTASLVHTGQHYDESMKRQFFDQLDIPEPDIDLEVGSGSHAVQTAEIMLRFEPELDRIKPDCVLVVGDVNSTIACALVAVKKEIPVVHVEAGLRSFDRAMPEEINRVLTDQISDLLFTTERCAEENLKREGVSSDKVVFVGNVMIDTLRFNLKRATPMAATMGETLSGQLKKQPGFALLTLHRPSNVDDESVLKRLLEEVAELSKRLPIIFPIHPRTRNKIEVFGLLSLLEKDNIHILPPLGYLDLLGLMSDARLVLTDSGGIQEETTALGVPCLTLRENTERPITVHEGTNTIVGTDEQAIRKAFDEILEGGGKSGRIPEFWDGQSAERIVSHLQSWLTTDA